MTDREVAIVLNLVPGIGFVKFSALRDHFGSAGAIAFRSEAEYREVPGIGEELAHKLRTCAWQEQLKDELDLADRAGVRVITYFDENYPEVLRQLYDPPLVLYVRGILGLFPDRTISVVGTRKMTSYGRRITTQLCREAVEAGFTVVSGLAYGVDTVAHRTTVDLGGTTVAVLGGGLMNIHPKENIPLARDIVDSGGALISEFPMKFPVSRQSFPRRNRIVAALSRGTLVTEAGLDSGALITAKLALEIGKEVFAVPGMADNPVAQGCHRLIKDGATLVENFTDILDALGAGFLPGLSPRSGETGLVYDRDAVSDLPEIQQQIIGALSNGDLTLEELQLALGLDTAYLLGELMQLEMKFLVEQDSQLRYRVVTGRA